MASTAPQRTPAPGREPTPITRAGVSRTSGRRRHAAWLAVGMVVAMVTSASLAFVLTYLINTHTLRRSRTTAAA